MAENKVAPIEMEMENQQPEGEKKEAGGKEWTNPLEFLMTCISFCVGLGNVWRFPYLCFRNGGSAFIIAMVIMLFLVGLPLFFLEITISQYSKLGTLDVWRLLPIFKGLGICCILMSAFVTLYYNILIAYSVIYAISSFLPKLPWASCDFEWNDAKCCSYDNLENLANDTIICARDTESPASQYFYKYVLNFSGGIDEFGQINWQLLLSLFICWFFIFLSLSKGVQSLGKVSYVTSIFPYIMIFILIIRGATLPGAGRGMDFYILNVDLDKLFTLQTWTDAGSQVYYILGVVTGGLYTLGKHNKFNYNHQKAAIFIAVLDAFTGILAGFAIFSVLGYMSEKTGVPVPELAVGGPGLSFIVYPEALSLMPLPQLWCVLFFLMMITIGFGSVLSLAECVLNSLSEKLSDRINTKKKELAFRFVICMGFFLLALPMTTNSGLYIQNLIDTYLSGYPYYILTTFEAVGLCWIYGIDRLKKNIKEMLGFYPNYYWIVAFIILPVLTFALFVIHTIQTVQDPSAKLNDYVYPAGAQAIGWIIVAILVGPFPIYIVVHLYKKRHHFNKEEFKHLFQPDPSWGPAVGLVEEEIKHHLHDHDGNLEAGANDGQVKNYQTFTENQAYEPDDQDILKEEKI